MIKYVLGVAIAALSLGCSGNSEQTSKVSYSSPTGGFTSDYGVKQQTLKILADNKICSGVYTEGKILTADACVAGVDPSKILAVFATRKGPPCAYVGFSAIQSVALSANNRPLVAALIPKEGIYVQHNISYCGVSVPVGAPGSIYSRDHHLSGWGSRTTGGAPVGGILGQPSGAFTVASTCKGQFYKGHFLIECGLSGSTKVETGDAGSPAFDMGYVPGWGEVTGIVVGASEDKSKVYITPL